MLKAIILIGGPQKGKRPVFYECYVCYEWKMNETWWRGANDIASDTVYDQLLK